MPGKAYRSKLNPHFEFIREARLREETWEEIARQISERGTPTDRSQVCKFFQRRTGGRTPLGFAPPPAGDADGAQRIPGTPGKGAQEPDGLDEIPTSKLKIIVS